LKEKDWPADVLALMKRNIEHDKEQDAAVLESLKHPPLGFWLRDELSALKEAMEKSYQSKDPIEYLDLRMRCLELMMPVFQSLAKYMKDKKMPAG